LLNRPQSRNAISKEMWDALPKTLDDLQKDGASVIVIAGEGMAFAAGADMDELLALDSVEQAREHWLSIRNALNMVARCEVPTIAMIHGPCLGGGCLLACACDIRICERDASFCVPVAHLGILLDDDNIARLVSLVGRGNAAEILLSAEMIHAERAMTMGLVNRVVLAHQLREITTSLAKAILSNVPAAKQHVKNALTRLTTAQGREQNQEAIVASYLSDEFRDRVRRAIGKQRS
jgi:enoyl-CoA hydratase/carnithine racemase